MKIKVCKTKSKAQKIGNFLVGVNAFDQEWAPGEKEFVKKAPMESLDKPHHRYWYVEKNDDIIAAMGVRENKYKSGGYEMNNDYLAVHTDYRKQGIATQLLQQVEKFVQSKKGRYIHVLTCDIDYYRAACMFYEANGYIKVAQIPDYYVQGEGRIDYFKKIK